MRAALASEPREPRPGGVCTLAHRRGSVRTMSNDSLWTDGSLDDLRREFGDVYEGRTVLVTGADGFMGSHLTDALVELGATVHAFVRAKSSGALNNIGHLRDRLKVHFADLTDRTSVDYLVRELKQAPDRPYVFHLGAQAHVGESWHRPYETVAANVLGTLNLLQSIVDWELELEKFDTAGTSEEYGNVREGVARPPRLRRRGRADPPRALADQPEVDLRDLEGRGRLPHHELLRRVRRAGRGHADVQQLRPAPEPALRDGDDHHAGARPARRSSSATLEPLRDFCFCTDGVRGHLMVAAQGAPGDVYVYGQGENISMHDWVDAHPARRRGAAASGPATAASSRRGRFRPGRATCSRCASATRSSRARRAGSRRCRGRTACSSTIRWYAENRDRWIGRVDWLPTGTRSAHRVTSRRRASERGRSLPARTSQYSSQLANSSHTKSQSWKRSEHDALRAAGRRRREGSTIRSAGIPRSAASPARLRPGRRGRRSRRRSSRRVERRARRRSGSTPASNSTTPRRAARAVDVEELDELDDDGDGAARRRRTRAHDRVLAALDERLERRDREQVRTKTGSAARRIALYRSTVSAAGIGTSSVATST